MSMGSKYFALELIEPSRHSGTHTPRNNFNCPPNIKCVFSALDVLVCRFCNCIAGLCYLLDKKRDTTREDGYYIQKIHLVAN